MASPQDRAERMSDLRVTAIEASERGDMATKEVALDAQVQLQAEQQAALPQPRIVATSVAPNQLITDNEE